MMEKRHGIWVALVMLAAILWSLAACGDNDNNETASIAKKKLYVCGMSQGVMATTTVVEVLFTEENIEWFNVKTKEIKFKTESVDDLYRETFARFNYIAFRLDDKVLFDSIKVTSIFDSRVYSGLVLCYGSLEDVDGQGKPKWGYYLYDCYPLLFADDEQVKANRERLAGQWGLFKSYLKSKGKLRR